MGRLATQKARRTGMAAGATGEVTPHLSQDDATQVVFPQRGDAARAAACRARVNEWSREGCAALGQATDRSAIPAWVTMGRWG